MNLYSGTSIRKISDDIVYKQILEQDETKNLKEMDNGIIKTLSNEAMGGVYSISLDFTNNPLPLACPSSEIENKIKIEFIGKKTVPSAIGQLTLNNDYFGFTSPISFIPNFDNISENDREWFTNLNISEYNVEFKNYNNSISFTADISKDQTDNNKLLLTSLTGDLPELNTIYENITMIIPSSAIKIPLALEIKTSYGMKLFGLNGKEVI